MCKREMIDRIMARNPSAQPDFLAEFTEEELGAYLRQLESVGSRPPSADDLLPHPFGDVGIGHPSVRLGG